MFDAMRREQPEWVGWVWGGCGVGVGCGLGWVWAGCAVWASSGVCPVSAAATDPPCALRRAPYTLNHEPYTLQASPLHPKP